MAVTYKIVDSDLVGSSVTTNVDTTATVQPGTLLRAVDMSTGAFGEGNVMYVKFTGTAGGVAGDSVVIDRGLKTCVQATAAGSKGDIGILLATVTSAQGTAGVFVYVLVRGIHDAANVTTGATVGAAGLSSTAGRLVTTGAGVVVSGLYIRVTGVSNIGTVEANFPSFGGSLS